MRRVVITGVGLRTALGSTPEELFEALLEGRSAVRTFEEWRGIKDLNCLVGAPALQFEPKDIPRKHRRSMGKVAMMAVSAAMDAVKQAGLSEALLTGGRTGTAIGSTMGSNKAEEEFWRHHIETGSAYGLKSTHFLKVMSHTCATNVAMFLGLTGEAIATNAACASSNQALGASLDRIRCGRAEVMLAGGADELHVAAAITFDVMGGGSTHFTDEPHRTPRPFDELRDGIVVGEGAGILVLEERDHALARGATILGEVLGYGGASDAVNMAHPAPDGMQTAIRLALADAGLEASAIDFVSAHATGTPIGDAAEAEALYRVFGAEVPVHSIKGHLGHTMGACGALEAITCLEAMRRGVCPPTLNLERPDVAPILLPTTPLARPLHRALSTNFAFGGVNTAVVLGDGRGGTE
jgi:3-oxoacyl-[acyl-carrier-protein] synthase II